MKALNKSIEEQNYGNMPSESPYSVLIHLGVKDVKTTKQYLSTLGNEENGIYFIDGFLKLYLVEFKDHVVLGTDKNALMELKKSGNLKSETAFEIPKSCKNSPFTLVSDNSQLINMLKNGLGSMGGMLEPSTLEGLAGRQYMFVENNELKAIAELTDKKTHPIMLYIRMVNQMLLKQEARRKKFESMQFQMLVNEMDPNNPE
jgi:hypothetical protein